MQFAVCFFVYQGGLQTGLWGRQDSKQASGTAVAGAGLREGLSCRSVLARVGVHRWEKWEGAPGSGN